MSQSQFPLYFTYCLTYLPTGQRYYGCRYGKDVHPSTLWTTYFTSSNLIKELIKKTGKDSFTYQIRKTFNDPRKCFEWEDKVLKRMKVANNPKWLNQNENTASDGVFRAMKFRTKEHNQAISRSQKGRKLTDEHKTKLSNAKSKWKTYIVTDPLGNVMIVQNLRKFCREHDLNNSNMVQSTKGKNKTSNFGWKCRYQDEPTFLGDG
jgi:hypothetical protein